jgi:hypothetical protein
MSLYHYVTQYRAFPVLARNNDFGPMEGLFKCFSLVIVMLPACTHLSMNFTEICFLFSLIHQKTIIYCLQGVIMTRR